MHPQHPWMMRVNAEEIQREVERSMRLQQARASASVHQLGLFGGLRRSIGQALIVAGDRIQPSARPVRDYDPGVELELAR
jgi:hypothetical protein